MTGVRLRRGTVARHWWSKRWLEAAGAIGLGERVRRGQTLARAGKVSSLVVRPGVLFGEVQAGRASAYETSVTVHRFTHRGWDKLTAALRRKAVFAAKLLVGEMPEGLEAAFVEAGFPLFPSSKSDLATGCACRDSETMCRHAAGVFQVFAQELDADPFLLLELRGLGREELLDRVLGRKKPAAPPLKAARTEKAPIERPKDPATFWKLKGALPQSRLPSPRSLPPPGARVRELGSPPFWRGESEFVETLEAYYAAVRSKLLH